VEDDLDLLVALVPLGLRLPPIGGVVGRGEVDVVGEGGQQRPRPEAMCTYGVELHRQHHDGGGEVEIGEHADHRGEDGVDVGGVPDHPVDIAVAEGLQQLQPDAGEDRSRNQCAQAQVLADREPEGRDQAQREDHHPDEESGDAQAEGAPVPVLVQEDRGAHRDQGAHPHEKDDHEGASPGEEGIGPAVAGHAPGGVAGVLERLGDAEGAVHRDDDADDDTGSAAAERLGGLELFADDGKGTDGRVEQLLLQVRIVDEHPAEHCRGEQQQRQDRDEGVVGEQRGEVVAEVVAELVDGGEREADDGVALLPLVDAFDGRHDTPSYGCSWG